MTFGCQKLTSQKWYLEVRSSFSWENTDFFKITILKSAFLHTKTQLYFSSFYHCKYAFGCQNLISQKWYLEVPKQNYVYITIEKHQVLKLYEKKIEKFDFTTLKKFYMKFTKNQISKNILNVVILVKNSVVFSGW